MSDCGVILEEAPHSDTDENGVCDVCERELPASDIPLPGDMDGNAVVDEDDAVYLLQHILMPEFFPVTQPVDYDGNGVVDEDDAVYLLQYVLMPDFFPL